jgi:hypothetical protein
MNRTALATASAISIALLSPVASATDAQEDAKERFEKGVSLFKEGDFEAALVEFKAAYKAKPHYAVLYNVGICLYKLHRYSEASKELRAYLTEGGKKVPKEQKHEVEGILNELETLVGDLSVICNVEGAELWVDGEYTDQLPTMFPAPLDVGVHEVEVRADGYKTVSQKVEIPGGKETTVEVQLEIDAPAVSAKKKLKPMYFWSSLGVTGALALTAIITGGVALKKEDEYAAMSYEQDWRAFKESTRKLTIATDVLWGLASASAIATIILAIKTEFKSEKKDQKLSLSPSIEPFGLSLHWGF